MAPLSSHTKTMTPVQVIIPLIRKTSPLGLNPNDSPLYSHPPRFPLGLSRRVGQTRVVPPPISRFSHLTHKIHLPPNRFHRLVLPGYP